MFEATEAFASLAQESRFKIFKLLIEYGRDGALAGTIADELGIPANTLSFHLSHMTRSGLLTSKKEGRTVLYFANIEFVEDLIKFMQTSCCARERKSKPKSCNERKC